jgi:hypothetical protein
MASVYEIPIIAGPQRFTITLSGAILQMRLIYADAPEGGWVLDIHDRENQPLIDGIPLVPGVNLLDQYDYLTPGGGLYIVTPGEPDKVPQFNDLGNSTKLFWVIP